MVGFEALSKDLALKCIAYFDNYVYYCARFDFIRNDGALTSSTSGISKAILSGGNIEVLHLGDLKSTSLTNFSQIYAIPKEKQTAFENCVRTYFSGINSLQVAKLKTWSQ
jgi:hypothetical protein